MKRANPGLAMNDSLEESLNALGVRDSGALQETLAAPRPPHPPAPSPIALPPDRERGRRIARGKAGEGSLGGGAPLPGEGSAMGEGLGVRGSGCLSEIV